MTYQLGVDLGTTYSAAAVHRNGRASMVSLGGRAPTIPSVILIREDGTVLVGDSAERRAASEPERVAREFKRRLGDPTPLIVAGAPHTPETLTAHLLSAIVEHVVKTEGGPADRIVVTHPANWGRFKIDLLSTSVAAAGLDPAMVSFITEPEGAAIAYAAQERVEPGEIVAVYDLGGGTFDAAVLRRTETGFSIVGRPEGIERLGGIDFDAAVYHHVTSGLGEVMAALDPNDPTALAAVARLRRDCVDAKEALSSDTDAVLPIIFPGHQTEVRITRREFESLIRPSLQDSIDAMRRTVDSAGLQLSDVSRILLVGGSSRIPLVSQLVLSELARPVAVDTHPKHTVALGAAFAAGGLLERAGNVAPGLEGGVAGGPPAPPAGPVAADGLQAGMTRVSDNPPPLIRPPAGNQPGAPAYQPPAANTPTPAPATPDVAAPPPVANPAPVVQARPVATPPPSAPSPGQPQPAQRVASPGSPPPAQAASGAPAGARPVGGAARADGSPAKAQRVSNPGPAPQLAAPGQRPIGGPSAASGAQAAPARPNPAQPSPAQPGPPPQGPVAFSAPARPDAAPRFNGPGPAPGHQGPHGHGGAPANPYQPGSAPPGLDGFQPSSSGGSSWWIWALAVLVVAVVVGVVVVAVL